MPLAGLPSLMLLMSCWSSNGGRRVAIGGPISPPLPSAPWHRAQRASKAYLPGSTACARASERAAMRERMMTAATRVRIDEPRSGRMSRRTPPRVLLKRGSFYGRTAAQGLIRGIRGQMDWVLPEAIGWPADARRRRRPS
jgi:hypothetical protein